MGVGAGAGSSGAAASLKVDTKLKCKERFTYFSNQITIRFNSRGLADLLWLYPPQIEIDIDRGQTRTEKDRMTDNRQIDTYADR